MLNNQPTKPQPTLIDISEMNPLYIPLYSS